MKRQHNRKALKDAAKELLPVPTPEVPEEIKTGHDLLEGRLSPQEEEFCQLFVSPSEFYGNGTQSYIEAFQVEIVNGTNQKYDVDGRLLDETKKKMTLASVRTAASALLTKPHILSRIHELLEDGGFNDQHADKTLQFLMTQRADLRVALGAVEAYNKLMSRIQEKMTMTHQFANEELTDEELMARIADKQKFFNKQ